MKELLTFPLQLLAFAAAFAAFYALVIGLNLSGLAATMVCALPVIAFIAVATGDNRPAMLKAFRTIAFWFYAVLLACAGIAVSVQPAP